MTAAGQESGRKRHREADASRSSVEAEGMGRTAEGGSCARSLVLVGNGRGHHQGHHQGDNCHPLCRAGASECGVVHGVAKILWLLYWQTSVEEVKCSVPACSRRSGSRAGEGAVSMSQKVEAVARATATSGRCVKGSLGGGQDSAPVFASAQVCIRFLL
jgi:hypothetical protein